MLTTALVKPYSVDLRERAVALLATGESSIAVAALLSVSDSWVRKMRLRLAANGHLVADSPPGKARMLSEKEEEQLCLLAFEVPDATLRELADLAAKRMKVQMSISTISRRLIEMGMTRKKRVSTPPSGSARKSKTNGETSTAGPTSAKRRASFSSTKQA